MPYVFFIGLVFSKLFVEQGNGNWGLAVRGWYLGINGLDVMKSNFDSP
jgi:hypothetical protein